MTRMKHWPVIVAGTLFCVTAISCLSTCLWTGYFRRVAAADTFQITPGMSREDVKAILGPPNHIESGGRYWAYYTDEGGILAPLCPMYVSFDEDGKVIR